MQITLNIPDEIASKIGVEPTNLARHVIEALAVDGYRSGRLSRGQVGELLQFNFWETESFLKSHDALLPIGKQDVESNVQSLRRMTRP